MFNPTQNQSSGYFSAKSLQVNKKMLEKQGLALSRNIVNAIVIEDEPLTHCNYTQKFWTDYREISPDQQQKNIQERPKQLIKFTFLNKDNKKSQQNLQNAIQQKSLEMIDQNIQQKTKSIGINADVEYANKIIQTDECLDQKFWQKNVKQKEKKSQTKLRTKDYIMYDIRISALPTSTRFKLSSGSEQIMENILADYRMVDICYQVNKIFTVSENDIDRRQLLNKF